MNKPDTNARRALDEIAAAIEQLIADLESRESKGAPLATTEIEVLAGKLQIHVEELLAASKNLQDQKLDS